MELTHEDVKKILEIIDRAEHLDEIELVLGGFRLHVRRGNASAQSSTSVSAERPVEAPKPTIVPAKLAEPALAEGEITIRAPMLGTFYRAPAPGQPPFVEEGQRVKANDTVCLIEVMKLFNSIRAGVDGVVRSILPQNGSLVEYNQMLFVIAPVPERSNAEAMSVPE